MKVWCPHADCAYSKGYKYPRRYMMPTNMITELVAGDAHNSLPRSLRQLGDQLDSVDQECSRLAENKALVSPNSRFTAYLSPKGSLVLKDQHRTMWDSLSSNLEFAKPPYRLVLTKDGILVIRDSAQNIVWLTTRNATGTRADLGWRPHVCPYWLRLADRGALEVVDGANQTT